MKAAAVLILALAALAGAMLLNKNRSISPPAAAIQSPSNLLEPLSNLESADTDNSAVSTPLAGTDAAQNKHNESEQPVIDTRTAVIVSDTAEQDRIDVLDLGKQALGEVDFRYWVGRLRNNPLLLQSALTEYLENSDTTRARNLAAILAEVNSPSVLVAATQLSQSTITTEQLNGLELLARLQPNNTHARDNALNLLATQTDPALLVATLNVFATPAQVVSAEQRQLLLDHAQLLSTHDNANVRALSISTISKWSRGNSDSAATRSATIGLNDADGAVRANAAASLVGVQNPTPQTKQNLFFVAANKSEIKTTRQLALYALSRMQLSENDRLRYEALEVEVRRTRH